MPGFPIIPAPPPTQGGGGVGVGVPLPPPPCPPCGDGNGDGGNPGGDTNCHGGKMIRASILYTSSCCIYHFHLSCAGVGDMAQWSLDFEPADPDNPPVFAFNFWDQDPTIDPSVMAGFVPFQLDGHPGYSDADETLDGYAVNPDTPPGADGSAWAETAFLEISAINGGFATLTITALPYDATAQTVGDAVTLDMSAFVDCQGVLLGSVVNVFSGGNFPDPTGDTSTPNRVWFWFVHSSDAQPGCIIEPGGGGTGVGSIIDDGSVGTVTINSGETRYCSSGHDDDGACFNDREGCSVSIADADVGDTVAITGPFTATPDPTTPGYFYLDLDTLGLYDIGDSTGIAGVCTLNITTDLGDAIVKIAYSFHA